MGLLNSVPTPSHSTRKNNFGTRREQCLCSREQPPRTSAGQTQPAGPPPAFSDASGSVRAASPDRAGRLRHNFLSAPANQSKANRQMRPAGLGQQRPARRLGALTEPLIIGGARLFVQKTAAPPGREASPFSRAEHEHRYSREHPSAGRPRPRAFDAQAPAAPASGCGVRTQGCPHPPAAPARRGRPPPQRHAPCPGSNRAPLGASADWPVASAPAPPLARDRGPAGAGGRTTSPRGLRGAGAGSTWRALVRCGAGRGCPGASRADTRRGKQK